MSVVYQRTLLADFNHPHAGYRVPVHEFGHQLMNLCFTEDDHRAWERLHYETVEAELGYGVRLTINVDEFFAELTEAYFSISNIIPKHHLVHFPPGVLERLEETYGRLTPVEAKESGYVHLVSDSGLPTPWFTAAGSTYEHSTLGYSVKLPPGWKVDKEGIYESLISSGPLRQMRIKHSYLDDAQDLDHELTRLAEQTHAAWEL